VASAGAEIDALRAAVARHFSVAGVVVTPFALTFEVTAPDGSIDGPFDRLRQELVPRNYIPTIGRERGETLVHVQRRPTPRFARREVNAALLVATVLTTAVFGGAWNWSAYAGTPLWSLESLGPGALFFGLPLLTILGAHEMGHYVVARRHKVRASLPFFLPSFPPLGTFGAFISMRDPIPNRRALLDIGVAGPLVGFAIAIPVTLAGLALSSTGTAPPDVTGDPQPSLLFTFLSLFFPLPAGIGMHPLAFAGWVGLFVTAINLLPAGQLDGGHVARALLGDKQHYLSWSAVLALFAMGTFYFGWVIFGFLILMLGVRHPPPLNDLTRLDPLRKLVGIGAVAVLVLTFIPQPFVVVPVEADFSFEALDGTPLATLEANVTMGTSVTIAFAVNNTGGLRERIGLLIDPRNLDRFGWTIAFASARIEPGSTTVPIPANPLSVRFVLNASERAILEIDVTAPAGPPPVTPTVPFDVNGSIEDADVRKDLEVVLRVV
jgi:membrane-associated protease RseP (regulator of RpoE activity)